MRIAIIIIFLFSAAPSFGYHFDLISWSEDGSLMLEQDGMINFLSQYPGSYGEQNYYEAMWVTGDQYTTFRADDNDSQSSITTINIDTNFHIESSIITENIQGDIYFASFLDFKVIDPNDNSNLLAFTKYQTISHTLGSTTDLTSNWEVMHSFIPDKDYVFAYDFRFYSYDPTKDEPSAYWLHKQLAALPIDWDVSEFVNVQCDWLGTSTIGFSHEPVPEPSTIMLLSAGMVGLLGALRKGVKRY